MKSRRSLGIFAVLAVAACGDAPLSPIASGSTASANARAAGGYIILLSDSSAAKVPERVAALGGTVVTLHSGVGVAVVDGLSEQAAASLGDLGEVAPDELFQVLDPLEVPAEVTAVDMDVTPSSPSNPAGAIAYARQWNMRLIRANQAWAAGHLGSSEVKVAILDTGIDGTHLDLQGRVDFANSASFATTDDALVNAFFPGAPLTTDLHYHGTHVAATVSSNAIAMAGVTSQTKLMAVKVLNVNGQGQTSWILSGILFAADRGADVISMSLGVTNPPFSMKNKANKDFFNKVLDRAFSYAHSKGSMVVVAAGNESQNLDIKHTYKMYCGSKHVICVSAVGPTAAAGTNGPWTNPDAFAPYSNYGLGKIDIAAPGGAAAPVTAACSRTSLQIPNCRNPGLFVVGLNGTSMATPHVSGLLSLLIAQNPIGRGALRGTMFSTAVDLGLPGIDARFGNGRIDVAKALGLP